MFRKNSTTKSSMRNNEDFRFFDKKMHYVLKDALDEHNKQSSEKDLIGKSLSTILGFAITLLAIVLFLSTLFMFIGYFENGSNLHTLYVSSRFMYFLIHLGVFFYTILMVELLISVTLNKNYRLIKEIVLLITTIYTLTSIIVRLVSLLIK